MGFYSYFSLDRKVPKDQGWMEMNGNYLHYAKRK
jgi:hypothetical protein